MRPATARPIAIVAALVAAAAPARAQQRLASTLITHNEITIARPAAAIWPRIVDPSAWKKGNALVHRAGTAGAVGELFAAVTVQHPDSAEYFVQNVELVAGVRRTIKLIATDGTLIGFASFSLVPSGGGTIVRYDVYGESRLPPELAAGRTAADVAAEDRAQAAREGARFQRELEALKRLVEAR